MEGVSSRLRKDLQRLGLLGAAKVAPLEPLIKHVDEGTDAQDRVAFVSFRHALLAKGTTEKQVNLVVGRVKRVIEGCGFCSWRLRRTGSRRGRIAAGLEHSRGGIG